MSQSVNSLNGTYTADPAHSEIGFVARHAMITKVRGSFDTFTVTASTQENLKDAKISVSIDVASVDTRNADRDAHLKGADFFDAEKFPHMTFESTAITASDDTTLSVTGDLTIKDVTKSITIDFDYQGEAKDPFGNDRVGFEASTDILRSDYGLTWNQALETGGVMVSDKIQLVFDISAIKS